MIPIMPKAPSTFAHLLTSSPSPFPSLLLLLLIFTFHVPTFRFFSHSLFSKPSPYYNTCGAGHQKIAVSSTPKSLPYGGFGWALRVAPIALLVVVSWLPRNDSAGVTAGKWGRWCQECCVPTISEHKAEEAEGIGGCTTPWVLVGMILLLFNMARRQALIRHCLFVSM